MMIGVRPLVLLLSTQVLATASHADPPGADALRMIDHPLFNGIAVLTVVAVLMLILLAMLSGQFHKRAALLQTEYDANTLLLEALEAARVDVTIFDRHMTVLRSGARTNPPWPDLSRMIRTHVLLSEKLVTTHAGGTIQTPADKGDARLLAETISRCLRAGETVRQVSRTRAGEIIETWFLRLGPGHFAAVRHAANRSHDTHAQSDAQISELERRNAQLMAFSAIAAHDLRAPLIQQMALLDFLGDDLEEAGIVLPSGIQRHLKSLSDLSHRMSELVTDLLDYAKAETEMSPPEILLPAQRLHEIIKLVPHSAAFRIDVDPAMPAICTNPTAFDIVMRNLISNAVRHHDRACGRIKIRGVARDADILIEVEDDGPGIPEECRQQIFEPFKRLGRSQSTGLGLAFVRKSVEGWGGQIDVDCPHPRGSVFRVTVPRAPATGMQPGGLFRKRVA